jgi:hypothetical protein
VPSRDFECSLVDYFEFSINNSSNSIRYYDILYFLILSRVSPVTKFDIFQHIIALFDFYFFLIYKLFDIKIILKLTYVLILIIKNLFLKLFYVCTRIIINNSLNLILSLNHKCLSQFNLHLLCFHLFGFLHNTSMRVSDFGNHVVDFFEVGIEFLKLFIVTIVHCILLL